jgi:ammonia channel protein AmtB
MITVDDPLDAVAVHFGGGLWGLIAASLFSNNGIVFGATYDSGMVRSQCSCALAQRHRKESQRNPCFSIYFESEQATGPNS